MRIRAKAAITIIITTTIPSIRYRLFPELPDGEVGATWDVLVPVPEPVGAEVPEVATELFDAEPDCELPEVDVPLPVVEIVWFPEADPLVFVVADPVEDEFALLPEPIVEGGGVLLVEVPITLAFVWLYTEIAPLLL